jgi:hypothetical protein
MKVENLVANDWFFSSFNRIITDSDYIQIDIYSENTNTGYRVHEWSGQQEVGDGWDISVWDSHVGGYSNLQIEDGGNEGVYLYAWPHPSYWGRVTWTVIIRRVN